MSKLNQADIDAAKSKYGENKVKVFDLPMDDEGTEVLEVMCHEIDMNALGQFMQWDGKNWKKSNEILIRGTVIGKEVCDKICSDSGLFLAAIDACMGMMPIRKSIVKN